MRHNAIPAAAMLAVATLLAGCSSGSHSHAKVTYSGKYTPLPLTTTAPTTTAAPTRYVGETWRWSNSTGAAGTTTALSYTQPVLANDPPDTALGVPPGSQWGRLDISVCETAGPSIGVSQEPWHLEMPDGSQADQTGLYGGDFPKPEFPQEGSLSAGDCARGGIMFPIPKGQRPVKVVYAPESEPDPIEWTIPSK